MIVGQQYRIIAELGAGGMGVVYQGVDLMLDREVAIKRLRSEFSSTPEMIERFRREAKMQARLNHSNIVHLYSWFQDDNASYMVLEFVNGTPLSRLIPVPWERALEIFLPILEGLEYAHAQGVLHRDLKPDNIMVCPRGEVKVMDFGIAHLLGTARTTREKSLVATLEYAAPELILGKTIDRRSDIYSLGILLYEMIVGCVPFEAQTEYDLLKMHLESVPPRLTAAAPGAPQFVEDAVMRAICKDPDARFTTCADFADFFNKLAPNTGRSRPFLRQTEEEEIDRCARRIDGLIAGGEIDVAAVALANALADYPGQTRLAPYEEKLKEARESRASAAMQDEKSQYLGEVLSKLLEFDLNKNLRAGLDLANEALTKHPRVTAFQIAAAHFRRLSGEIIPESQSVRDTQKQTDFIKQAAFEKNAGIG